MAPFSTMNRLRFLSLTFSSLALVGAASFAGACSHDSNHGPLPSTAGDDAGADGSVEPGPVGETDADVQALGKWCFDEEQRLIDAWSKDPSQPYPEFEHEIGGAQLVDAPKVYASGAKEILLSQSGCTRLFVKRENGRVTSETLVRAPFKTEVDPKTYELIYTPAAVARWTYTTDEERFTADEDGDGFAEFRQQVRYGHESVREEFAPANDVLIARTTATILPDEVGVHVKREELVDGAMKVTREVTAPLVQTACNFEQPKPPPPKTPTGVWKGPSRACTSTELEAITKLVSTALQKGSGCLYAAGMRAESDMVLKTYVRNEARIDCTDDAKQEMWAANELGYGNFFPGKVRLIFYSKLFGEPQSFQEGTVGHELFHFFDVHDPDLESAANEEQLRLSDPVYACEYLCFGGKPNTCHLAACQQKTLSTGWKGKQCAGTVKPDDVYKIEKARGDGVSISSCPGGFQVGALCRSKNNGTQVQFCTTEEDCKVACAGPCESKSLSCLNDCR